jgi:hypothetical protein
MTVQAIILLLLFPPFGACLWWAMSKGWAAELQGSTISATTRTRQRFIIWLLIPIAYVLEAIGYFIKHSQ